MRRNTAIVLTVAALLPLASAFFGAWPPKHLPAHLREATAGPCDPPNDCGEPLYLTPIIKSGNITAARAASKVTLAGFSFTSYSGYLTVNETTKNALYFWYFPAQNGDTKAPLILWLQGGPGASSLFGLFGEFGPITVNKDLKPTPKPFTWNSKYQLIFVDQPAGTGYSQQGSAAGLVNNSPQGARELLEALKQFFTVFTETRTVPFYVAGESYGGKYAPWTVYTIHEYNRQQPVANRLPLNGLILGDPWSDPESTMPTYGRFLFDFGLIDEEQTAIVDSHMEKAETERRHGRFAAAFPYWNAVWGDWGDKQSLFTNFTGGTYTEDMSKSNFPADSGYMYYHLYITSVPANRKAMHVGALPYGGRDIYKQYTDSGDFMDSVVPIMPTILNNYRALIYNGNMDGICGAPSTDAFIAAITWSADREYHAAPRKIWKVRAADSEVAGYAKSTRDGRFTRAIIRNAGHLLPMDQPERAFEMIDRFISGKGF